MNLFLSLMMMTPGIVPLSGVDPMLPQTELSVFDPVINGAQIVAIGESVHGSAGFLQMEHRLARYMIEQKGFRVVMVENPVIRSAGLTRWLDHCENGKPLPIDLVYLPTDPDRDFFNWMCSFNKSHPHDRIRFRGMDIWDRPWEWQEGLQTINQRLHLGLDEPLKTTFAHCWFHNQKSWDQYKPLMKILAEKKQIPPEDYLPCTKALATLKDGLDAKLAIEQKDLSVRSQLYYFAEFINSARGWQSYYNFVYQDLGKMWDSRDLAQAQNEFNIWAQEGFKKAIILAHTSHASKDDSPSDWWKWGFGKIHSGVSFLRKRLGNRVRTIGLTGYDVTGVQGQFLKPTSPDSLDKTLHDAGYKVAFVNPYSDFIRAKPRWWIENENSADAYPDGVNMVPRDNFDAFVFVDFTHEGHEILPWRNVWLW